VAALTGTREEVRARGFMCAHGSGKTAQRSTSSREMVSRG
jgi:hypothetical protein